MADSSTQLHLFLARMQAGDLTARNELFRHMTGRLERLTRKMLHDFPGVRRWAGTDDVLQSALIRLLRTLQAVRPATPRDFLGLAAEQIRRELIDLARHYYGPQGLGANHASRGGAEGSRDPIPAHPDPPPRLPGPARGTDPPRADRPGPALLRPAGAGGKPRQPGRC